jgi:hypothetical protein
MPQNQCKTATRSDFARPVLFSNTQSIGNWGISANGDRELMDAANRAGGLPAQLAATPVARQIS